jgi:hypothetical protein
VKTVQDAIESEGWGVVDSLVKRLRPWPGNPREISPERLEDLKASPRDDPEMLRARPLIALRDGTVIMGNQRLRAVQELSWTSVPVLFVDLDSERARMWAFRDNNQWGSWDEPALAELLAEMQADGLDLALTGFTKGELDRVLATLPPPSDPDDAPPRPSQPDSRPGEIYELGPHHLLCGDARDPKQVAQLMAGECAEVLWTDPPYGVGYTGRTADKLRIANDTPHGLATLLEESFATADQVLTASARFYICSPAGPQGTTFREAIGQIGWQFHQAVVWVKNSPVLGHSDHQFMHEDVLYGWKPGPGRAGRGRHDGSRWYRGECGHQRVLLRPAGPQCRASDHETGCSDRCDVDELEPAG